MFYMEQGFKCPSYPIPSNCLQPRRGKETLKHGLCLVFFMDLSWYRFIHRLKNAYLAVFLCFATQKTEDVKHTKKSGERSKLFLQRKKHYSNCNYDSTKDVAWSTSWMHQIQGLNAYASLSIMGRKNSTNDKTIEYLHLMSWTSFTIWAFLCILVLFVYLFLHSYHPQWRDVGLLRPPRFSSLSR